MHKEVLFFLLLKSILHRRKKKDLFSETNIFWKKKDRQVPVDIFGVSQCKTSARPSRCC